jgi:pimeloyl-ACP methyl ester carboxylesterase
MKWLKRIVRVVLSLAFGLMALVMLLVSGWAIYQNQLADASEIYSDHRADAPGAFANTNGLDMHYRSYGDVRHDPTGAPILFIHGYNQNASPEFAKLAERLQPNRASLLPDMLGFGFSARPTDPARYSLRGQANNLAALLDALGIAQVDVVGGSWGGAVAAQFALDYPQRVRKLVLFNAQIAETDFDFISRSGSLPLGLGRAISWYAIGGGAGGAGFFTSQCPKDYCPTQAEIDQRMRHALIKGTTDAMTASSNAPTTYPEKRVPQDLGNLTVSTTVLHSRNDALIPIAKVEQTVKQMPAGTELIVMDFDTHVPHLKIPDEVVPLIVKALATH